MQKIISFLNQKGGVGKTTLLFHFAHYLQEKGKKVLVCDLDTQGNASSVFLGDNYLTEFNDCRGTGSLLGEPIDAWKGLYAENENGISVVHADQSLVDVEDLSLVAVISSLKKSLAALSDFDYILLDCPPTIGKRVFAALHASTNVISPLEPRKFSLDGIEALVKSILSVKSENPDLVFNGMILNRVNSRSSNMKKNIEIIKEAFGQKVFLNTLVEREPIADAIEEQKPVWKLKKTGSVRLASSEMKRLLEELLWRVENGIA